MGILDRFRRKNVNENRATPAVSYGSFSITSFFGDGELVTEEQAMKIPSVAASVELITSSIAQLPIYLYKENEKGEVIKIPDNRVFLLNDEPNELINGYNFKKQIVKDYLFHGASYTKVERVRNDVIALYELPIEEVTITKYRNGYKYSAVINLVYINNASTKQLEFQPEELVIILKDSDDGVIGNGILKNNSDAIKIAIDEQNYTNNILKNGALPIGVLKSATRLTDAVVNKLRASWQTLYGGATNAGKTIILEEGLDYKSISLNPEEMELTNTRKNTIAEIARIFSVPESMINAAANKYASNEQNNLYFLQYCIAPIINAIEAALNKSLLLESEKEQGYYFRFDTSEILRTTEKEKIENTVTAMTKGLLSINESRGRIDAPALDVDYFMWGLGNIFYNPKTNDMIIPNLGKVVDPDKPESFIDPNLQNQNQVQQPKKEEKEPENDDSKAKSEAKNEQKSGENKPKTTRNRANKGVTKT